MTAFVSNNQCESVLGRKLQKFRSDRPDEWRMDEFIREAEKLSEMLFLAWEAVNEAGYEGYSNELRDFIESDKV